MFIFFFSFQRKRKVLDLVLNFKRYNELENDRLEVDCDEKNCGTGFY